jgi:hypothetical protein
MKALLSFKLPKEMSDFNAHFYEPDYRSVIHSTKELIRRKLKHGELEEPVRKALEEIQEHLFRETERIPEE